MPSSLPLTSSSGRREETSSPPKKNNSNNSNVTDSSKDNTNNKKPLFDLELRKKLSAKEKTIIQAHCAGRHDVFCHDVNSTSTAAAPQQSSLFPSSSNKMSNSPSRVQSNQQQQQQVIINDSSNSSSVSSSHGNDSNPANSNNNNSINDKDKSLVSSPNKKPKGSTSSNTSMNTAINNNSSNTQSNNKLFQRDQSWASSKNKPLKGFPSLDEGQVLDQELVDFRAQKSKGAEERGIVKPFIKVYDAITAPLLRKKKRDTLNGEFMKRIMAAGLLFIPLHIAIFIGYLILFFQQQGEIAEAEEQYVKHGNASSGFSSFDRMTGDTIYARAFPMLLISVGSFIYLIVVLLLPYLYVYRTKREPTGWTAFLWLFSVVSWLSVINVVIPQYPVAVATTASAFGFCAVLTTDTTSMFKNPQVLMMMFILSVQWIVGTINEELSDRQIDTSFSGELKLPLITHYRDAELGELLFFVFLKFITSTVIVIGGALLLGVSRTMILEHFDTRSAGDKLGDMISRFHFEHLDETLASFGLVSSNNNNNTNRSSTSAAIKQGTAESKKGGNANNIKNNNIKNDSGDNNKKQEDRPAINKVMYLKYIAETLRDYSRFIPRDLFSRAKSTLFPNHNNHHQNNGNLLLLTGGGNVDQLQPNNTRTNNNNNNQDVKDSNNSRSSSIKDEPNGPAGQNNNNNDDFSTYQAQFSDKLLDKKKNIVVMYVKIREYEEIVDRILHIDDKVNIEAACWREIRGELPEQIEKLNKKKKNDDDNNNNNNNNNNTVKNQFQTSNTVFIPDPEEIGHHQVNSDNKTDKEKKHHDEENKNVNYDGKVKSNTIRRNSSSFVDEEDEAEQQRRSITDDDDQANRFDQSRTNDLSEDEEAENMLSLLDDDEVFENNNNNNNRNRSSGKTSIISRKAARNNNNNNNNNNNGKITNENRVNSRQSLAASVDSEEGSDRDEEDGEEEYLRQYRKNLETISKHNATAASSREEDIFRRRQNTKNTRQNIDRNNNNNNNNSNHNSNANDDDDEEEQQQSFEELYRKYKKKFRRQKRQNLKNLNKLMEDFFEQVTQVTTQHQGTVVDIAGSSCGLGHSTFHDGGSLTIAWGLFDDETTVDDNTGVTDHHHNHQSASPPDNINTDNNRAASSSSTPIINDPASVLPPSSSITEYAQHLQRLFCTQAALSSLHIQDHMLARLEKRFTDEEIAPPRIPLSAEQVERGAFDLRFGNDSNNNDISNGNGARREYHPEQTTSTSASDNNNNIHSSNNDHTGATATTDFSQNPFLSFKVSIAIDKGLAQFGATGYSQRQSFLLFGKPVDVARALAIGSPFYYPKSSIILSQDVYSCILFAPSVTVMSATTTSKHNHTFETDEPSISVGGKQPQSSSSTTKRKPRRPILSIEQKRSINLSKYLSRITSKFAVRQLFPIKLAEADAAVAQMMNHVSNRSDNNNNNENNNNDMTGSELLYGGGDGGRQQQPSRNFVGGGANNNNNNHRESAIADLNNVLGGASSRSVSFVSEISAVPSIGQNAGTGGAATATGSGGEVRGGRSNNNSAAVEDDYLYSQYMSDPKYVHYTAASFSELITERQPILQLVGLFSSKNIASFAHNEGNSEITKKLKLPSKFVSENVNHLEDSLRSVREMLGHKKKLKRERRTAAAAAVENNNSKYQTSSSGSAARGYISESARMFNTTTSVENNNDSSDEFSTFFDAHVDNFLTGSSRSVKPADLSLRRQQNHQNNSGSGSERCFSLLSVPLPPLTPVNKSSGSSNNNNNNNNIANTSGNGIVLQLPHMIPSAAAEVTEASNNSEDDSHQPQQQTGSQSSGLLAEQHNIKNNNKQSHHSHSASTPQRRDQQQQQLQSRMSQISIGAFSTLESSNNDDKSGSALVDHLRSNSSVESSHLLLNSSRSVAYEPTTRNQQMISHFTFGFGGGAAAEEEAERGQKNFFWKGKKEDAVAGQEGGGHGLTDSNSVYQSSSSEPSSLSVPNNKAENQGEKIESEGSNVEQNEQKQQQQHHHQQNTTNDEEKNNNNSDSSNNNANERENSKSGTRNDPPPAAAAVADTTSSSKANNNWMNRTPNLNTGSDDDLRNNDTDSDAGKNNDRKNSNSNCLLTTSGQINNDEYDVRNKQSENTRGTDNNDVFVMYDPKIISEQGFVVDDEYGQTSSSDSFRFKSVDQFFYTPNPTSNFDGYDHDESEVNNSNNNNVFILRKDQRNAFQKKLHQQDNATKPNANSSNAYSSDDSKDDEQQQQQEQHRYSSASSAAANDYASSTTKNQQDQQQQQQQSSPTHHNNNNFRSAGTHHNPHSVENFASFFYTPLAIHVVTLRESMACLEEKWTLDDEVADKLRVLNAATSYYLTANFDWAMRLLQSGCVVFSSAASTDLDLDPHWGPLLTPQGIDGNFAAAFLERCSDIVQIQVALFAQYQELYQMEHKGQRDEHANVLRFTPAGWDPRLNFDKFVE